MTIEGLSEQDLAILRLIDQHWSNAEIAERLALSLRTVEWHVSRMLAKLPATDRRQAARMYRRHFGAG